MSESTKTNGRLPVDSDSASRMQPGWERGRDAILTLGLNSTLRPVETRTSNITDKWGVRWSPEYIARDLLQNFFDANRTRLDSVVVRTDGTTVTVEAPTTFSLEHLFYLGSTKGDDDVGEYGEGFKAATISLLRDHGIEPISQSGRDFVYMRLSSEPVASSTMRPVLFDFFECDEPVDGVRLVLRGCGSDLIREMQGGLTHFFYPGNPLLGDELWRGPGGGAAIYKATGESGYVFYRNVRRGRLEQIPLVLVLNRQYKRLDANIGSDRDRKPFADVLLGKYYSAFAGLANWSVPASIIVQNARQTWKRGHPLLAALAKKSYRWDPLLAKHTFQDLYYAESHARTDSQRVQYAAIEEAWRNEGRERLPAYFETFGVTNAPEHVANLNKLALEEQKRLQHRRPMASENKAIEFLRGVMRELDPRLVTIFESARTAYSVAESEVLLGELRRNRGYQSYEVFLSASVFRADFARALSTFLHEHAHIFGGDGSRGFSDALTELIEAVVRERTRMEELERSWDQVRTEVVASQNSATEAHQELDILLDSATEEELRVLLRRLPRSVLMDLIRSDEN